MALQPDIFRAYDIRGLSPEDLNADAAFVIGQSIIRLTGARSICVGRDMRETSPMVFNALVRGMCSQGATVTDIGLITTPMLYFAVGSRPDFEAGSMITASHMPPEYNGIKICRADVSPIGFGSGMEELRDIALRGPYPDAAVQGTVIEENIADAYIERMLSLVDISAIRPMTIAVDTANGMEGIIIEQLLSRIPQLTPHYLFLELDGTFPNHEANPLKHETLDTLKQTMRTIGADIGIAYDADGDRLGVIDETGIIISGDILGAMIGANLLLEHPGHSVVYDVRASWSVPESAKQAGGVPVLSRVGHGFIKPTMRKVNAIFGAELSGHFYYADLYTADSTDYSMLILLCMMSVSGKSLSELVAEYRSYVHSPEINTEVHNKDAVMQALADRYRAHATTVIDIDGLRMEFRDSEHPDNDWWFNVRPSANDPVLRLNVEARTDMAMNERVREVLALIAHADSV